MDLDHPITKGLSCTATHHNCSVPLFIALLALHYEFEEKGICSCSLTPSGCKGKMLEEHPMYCFYCLPPLPFFSPGFLFSIEKTQEESTDISYLTSPFLSRNVVRNIHSSRIAADTASLSVSIFGSYWEEKRGGFDAANPADQSAEKASEKATKGRGQKASHRTINLSVERATRGS